MLFVLLHKHTAQLLRAALVAFDLILCLLLDSGDLFVQFIAPFLSLALELILPDLCLLFESGSLLLAMHLVLLD